MLNINFVNKHVIFIERKDLETNHRGRELIPSPSCDLKRKFSEEEIVLKCRHKPDYVCAILEIDHIKIGRAHV